MLNFKSAPGVVLDPGAAPAQNKGRNLDILKTLEQRLNTLNNAGRRKDFQAAVIVALIPEGEKLEVLLEKRADALRRSSGEVSFPGGQVEDGELPFKAGLRELEEEVGIGSEQVTLLGRLPDLERRGREIISPFVCSLKGKLEFKVQRREVAEVFRVPLDYFIEPGFQTAQMIEEYSLSADFPSHLLPEGGRRRRFLRPVHYIRYQDHLIWGITAEILVSLLDLLK